MATDEPAASDPQINFLVKASNDTKYPISLAGTATVGDLKQKLSGSDYADAPVDRLRLIFSGRVLKDGDTIAGSKIKEGHTIHLVKSAASNVRQNPAASSGGSPAPAAVPTNIAAGTGNNPLAALTGARYAGFHGLPSASTFGADGGMTQGMNPDDFERMLEDPNFLQQMNEMMDSPAFQQMLLENPIFRDNPMARQMVRDPATRRMLMNPQIMLQQMRAQQRAETASARGNFPAPGNTDNTAEAAANAATGAGTGAAANPFGAGANPFAQLPAGNPFAALLNPQGGANPLTGGTSPGAQSNNPSGVPSLDSLLSGLPPDFFRAMGGVPGAGGAGAGATGGAAPDFSDPDFMAATMRLMQNPDFQTLARSMPGGGLPGFGAPAGGGAASPPAGGAANPLADFYGSLGGMGGMAPPRTDSPADTRPPEERYADQLRQLNDMGFFDFDGNVQALRRSGGSVQGAIEYLLSNP